MYIYHVNKNPTFTLENECVLPLELSNIVCLLQTKCLCQTDMEMGMRKKWKENFIHKDDRG